MSLSTTVGITGILGGLAWVARSVLTVAGDPVAGLPDGLYWVGLVLLAVALAGAGVVMVRRAPVWLRAIVAVSFALLVWSVLEVLHPLTADHAVDAVAGALVAIVSIWRLRAAAAAAAEEQARRVAPSRRASRATRGSHAR